MRSTSLAFFAVLSVAALGCGSGGGTLDGGNKDMGGGGNTDMAGQSPDLRKPALSCFGIFDCINAGTMGSTCFSKASKVSQTLFQAFVTCFSDTCGSSTMQDGGAASKPCSGTDTSDAGAALCDQCFSNIQAGPNTIFTDMNGNKLMCSPTTAPECGACVMQITNCALDCTSDADCMGITNGGNPTTCQPDSMTGGGSCQ